MGALEDKARKAKVNATKMETGIAARETVARNAKTAKVNLSMREEQKATKVLKDRMQIDRSKTAARATAIEKVQGKKEAVKRANAATGNMTKAKTKTTVVSKAVTKPAVKATVKSVVKPAPAPTPTSLNQLKNTMGTQMAIGEKVTAGSKKDPNIYRGSYGGQDWSFSKGKATRVK
jgi:hypothetical protein